MALSNIKTTGLEDSARGNAVLVGVALKGNREQLSEAEVSIDELEGLLETAGGTVVAKVIQNIESSITKIVESFEEMKQDLLFLLKENEEQGE